MTTCVINVCKPYVQKSSLVAAKLRQSYMLSNILWEMYIHPMMTSSNGNIFRVTGPLCGECTGPGEFPTQWPVTRSFDVFFDLRLNKRLSEQPWGWWFETPSWSLWRQCNGLSFQLFNDSFARIILYQLHWIIYVKKFHEYTGLFLSLGYKQSRYWSCKRDMY